MPAFRLSGSTDAALMGLGQNGLIQIGIGATLFGRGEIVPSFLPNDFVVEAAAEGPQIMVSWSDPDEATASPFEYQLRRGSHFHPRTLDEGVLVSSGTSSGDQKISDGTTEGDLETTLRDDQIYYYTLFVKDPTQVESPPGDDPWFTHGSLQGHALAFQTGFWGDRVFAILPAIYRFMDKRPDLGGGFGQQALVREVGAAGSDRENEVFHADENQVLLQGQLQRFLKILGLQMDQVRKLIQHHIKDLHADEADPRLLKFLSATYGWKSNEELPLRNRRREAANATTFYKQKPAARGVESQMAAAADLVGADTYEVRDTALRATLPTKEFGAHIVGQDLVGLPTSDLLLGDDPAVSSQSNAPSNLTTRPYALNYNARADIYPGNIRFEYAADVPDTRSYILDPGSTTCEFWLRVNEWPEAPDSAATRSLTSTSEFVSPVVTAFFSDPSPSSPRAWMSFQVALRTAMRSGVLSREVVVRDGDTSAPQEVFSVPESAGLFGSSSTFHVAVARRPIVSGTVPSPEGDTFRWEIYINGTSYASVDLPSGYLLTTAISQSSPLAVGDDAIVVGYPDNTAVEPVDWTIDELRIWRSRRTAAEIAANYQQTLNSHYPNLVVHARFNDIQSPDPANFAEELTLNVVEDTSIVEGHGSFESPHVASPTLSHGAVPVYVGPVMPDPFVTQEYDDEIRRRDRQLGMREGFVTGDKYHLRRVRLRGFAWRRQNG